MPIYYSMYTPPFMNNSKNFYTRSVLFVILSVVGAVFSYLIYLILARIFNLSEFGDYVTIVGISNQVLGILLAFSVISIGLVKQYGESEANVKAQVIQKVLLWLFLMLSLVILAASQYLQHILKIQHVAEFYVLALIMLLAVPANIWVGYLQGHKELVRVGIYGAFSAALKLVGVVALAAHFGVVGSLWGFLLGSLAGLIILYGLPGKTVPRIERLFTRLQPNEKEFLRKNKGYIVQAVFVVAGLVFLQNYDLILVKVLFNSSSAGIYSGISVFSNALYFISFLLIWVLLPEFSIDNQKNNQRVLRTAYLLISGLSIAVLVGGLVLADRLLPIFLNQSFAGQGHTLVVASLYQLSLVSVALYAFYLLVLRKRRSVSLTACVLLSCTVIPLHFTSSPYAMISSLLASVVIGVSVWSIFGAIFYKNSPH